jgi:hypothetical protein
MEGGLDFHELFVLYSNSRPSSHGMSIYFTGKLRTIPFRSIASTLQLYALAASLPIPLFFYDAQLPKTSPPIHADVNYGLSSVVGFPSVASDFSSATHTAHHSNIKCDNKSDSW